MLGREVRAQANDDVAAPLVAGVEGEDESVLFIGHDGLLKRFGAT